jgi:glucose/arabinose dehydrogenase
MWGGLRARIRVAGVVAGCALALLVLPARAGAVGLESVPGTFDRPIFVTSPPGDPRLFVVERFGHIQVLHDGMESQFLDISALIGTGGERGLESMAFDPNYASNGLFYVFYTGDGEDAGGAAGDIHIDEFKVSSDPNVADAGSRRTVWTFSHSAIYHNGGQLRFGPDGLLYISVGDNTDRQNPQSLANPYGKILRIDPHGTADGDHGIPSSNPFPSSGTPEIWSLGLRNPFRFSFDRLTDDLVIADVGEISHEEIDFSPSLSGRGRGADYGWPCREGFSPGPDSCSGSFVEPVFDYPHTDPGGDLAHGCAIIGGYVYRGSQIPELAGRYLYSDFCNNELRSLRLSLPLASDDRPEGVDGPANTFSFGEDANCELYVMGPGPPGTVQKVVGSGSGSTPPACVTSPPAASTPSTALVSPTPTIKKKKGCKRKKTRAARKRCEKKKKRKRS